MIERKIEIEKDNVIKSIDENLLSTYLLVGWSKVEAKKENKIIENLKSEVSFAKKSKSKED